MKRFQQNQREIIRTEFCEHPYYKLCQSVFEVFQELCSTMVLTPEQLFADASKVFDSIIQSGDKKCEICKNLWIDTYNQYRDQVGNAACAEDTKTEVAAVIYAVMFALQSVSHSYYKCTLQRTLLELIHSRMGIDKDSGKKLCLVFEDKLRSVINEHSTDMFEWMSTYFTSADSLTTMIDSVLQPKKKVRNCQSKSSDKKCLIYYTLSYNCKDENTRLKRITFVRRKWEEWDWIETNTDLDNFENFFSGKTIDCQLKWKAPKAILTLLMQKLVDRKDLFNKQVGCSARSIVINQFKQGNYNNHTEHVHEPNLSRIEWTIKLLDYTTPLEFPQLPYNQGEDISDKAIQEVFSGNMHVTKDINKYRN